MVAHDNDLIGDMIADVDVNTQDNRGRTPLMHSIAAEQEGRGNAVEPIFISGRVDLSIEEIRGRTAFTYALLHEEGGSFQHAVGLHWC